MFSAESAFLYFLKKLEDNGDRLPANTQIHPPLDFEFDNTTCYVCNGYYGPSFGEPVCGTCHAFLFPDFPSYLPSSYFYSEKTDDGDSGNDEPSDLNYISERRMNRACNLPSWWYNQNSLDSETSPEDDASRASNSAAGASNNSNGGGEAPLGGGNGSIDSSTSAGGSGAAHGPPGDVSGRNGAVPGGSGGTAGGISGAAGRCGGAAGGNGSAAGGSGGSVGWIGGLAGGCGGAARGSGGAAGGNGIAAGVSGGAACGSSGAAGGSGGAAGGSGIVAGGSGGAAGGSGAVAVGSGGAAGESGGATGRSGGAAGGSGGTAEGCSGASGGTPGPAGGRGGGAAGGSGGVAGGSGGAAGESGGATGRSGGAAGGSGGTAGGCPGASGGSAGPAGGIGDPAGGSGVAAGGTSGAAAGSGGLAGGGSLAGHSPPSPPPDVAFSLQALSMPRLPDNLAPGLVEELPSEVLLSIFNYLDDLSLCSCACVCSRWRQLVGARVSPSLWAVFTARRFPLYRPFVGHLDWHKKYQTLVESCFCRSCVMQMCAQAQPDGEENAWRRNRLRIELKMLRNDPPEGIAAMPLDAKCCHWQATVTGPVGSPYEGGIFYLYIQVPYAYPMSPPVVRFLTRILHPNISRHGDVGIDSVHHNWSLALTISKVLISIQSLLTDPYTAVCMEPELGEMYTRDRPRFETLARNWTWRYAMHDILPL